jgi:hypothetical protein
MVVDISAQAMVDERGRSSWGESWNRARRGSMVRLPVPGPSKGKGSLQIVLLSHDHSTDVFIDLNLAARSRFITTLVSVSRSKGFS